MSVEMGTASYALDESIRLGEILARSGFFNDTREAAQAVVKILAGRELGFGPIASMTGIFIVKGKVTMSANLMAAAVQRSGRFDYTIVELDDDHAELLFFSEGEEAGTVTFTMADAKRAGLAGGDNWKKYPSDMLFARAMSRGTRRFCPAVFGGPVYTPEELGADADIDGQLVSPAPVEQLAVAASNGGDPHPVTDATPHTSGVSPTLAVSSAPAPVGSQPVPAPPLDAPAAAPPRAREEEAPSVPPAPVELDGPEDRTITAKEALMLLQLMDEAGLRPGRQRFLLLEVGVDHTEDIDVAVQTLTVAQARQIAKRVPNVA